MSKARKPTSKQGAMPPWLRGQESFARFPFLLSGLISFGVWLLSNRTKRRNVKRSRPFWGTDRQVSLRSGSSRPDNKPQLSTQRATTWNKWHLNGRLTRARYRYYRIVKERKKGKHQRPASLATGMGSGWTTYWYYGRNGIWLMEVPWRNVLFFGRTKCSSLC